MERKQRQALAPIMSSIILIGIAAGIGAVVYIYAGELTESAFETGPIDIRSLSITNSGSASYVSANVKNTNDESLNDMKILMYVGESALDELAFSQTSINIDAEASMTTLVLNQTNPLYLPTGTKVLVVIEATDSTGTVTSEPESVRVS